MTESNNEETREEVSDHHHTEDALLDDSDVVRVKDSSIILKKEEDANKEVKVDEESNNELRDVPIDRGWAWAVVAGCFGMHVLVLGGMKSFGVLFVEFRDKYNVTARELGMIQGIAFTFMLGLGLGANVLAVRFTCQKIVFIGGILASLGFILSAYIPSIDLLYLTYGVITGLGFAFSYCPSVVMVGIHFKKRRALANGISLSGSGVGSFVLPNLMRWMLNEFGLAGCLLLTGGLMLNVCVCALLYRPLSNYRRLKQFGKIYNLDTKNQEAGLERLIDENKNNSGSEDYNSDLQIKDENSCKNSEFATCEYASATTLQSIPQKEMKGNSWSLCAKIRRSSDKKSQGKAKQKKGQKLFNWSLLSNPVFIIYAVSCGLGNFAYPNVFLMLPAHAESNGQDRDSAALLVSIIGITDIAGRLFFGWFSDLKLFPIRYGFVASIAISAVLNLAIPAMTTFTGLIVYASLYGFFAGSYMALISVMLAEALGVEKLSSAYGLVMLFMSLGLLPGPILCGIIRDSTQKWDYSFVLCGVIALIGSIPPLFEPSAKRCVDVKEEKKKRKAIKTEDGSAC